VIAENVIVRLERLRDEAEFFSRSLRKQYRAGSAISNKRVQAEARRMGEMWVTELSLAPGLSDAIGANVVADLSVHFQRLISLADKATCRRQYDEELKAILDDYRTRVVIPAKSRRRGAAGLSEGERGAHGPTGFRSVFIGHAFTEQDGILVKYVERVFAVFGITCRTGERPEGNRISEKVKRRIADSDGFIGIFGRRDRLARNKGWTTSDWVIDEKAYALALNKKLILLRESGVSSIGGIQGDYEYLEFDRDDLADIIVRLIESVQGF
jgi:hypothetical protein